MIICCMLHGIQMHVPSDYLLYLRLFYHCHQDFLGFYVSPHRLSVYLRFLSQSHISYKNLHGKSIFGRNKIFHFILNLWLEIAGLEEGASSTHNTFVGFVAICKSIIGRTKIFHIILNLKVYGGKSLVLKKVLRAHITPL